MKTTIETDLKEILGKLDNHLERIDNRLSNLELNQIEIKSEIKILDEKLSGQINALDEKLSGQINALDEKLSGQINTLDQKVSGIDKRLEIVESRVNGLTGWLIGVLFPLVGGLLDILGKLTFFPNP